MNYYERHIGDYLKDTAHLSLLEHGIYARLLDVYYTRECGIDDDMAARLVGARTEEERGALETVLNEFFTLEGGVWVQARCDREIARYREKTQKAAASAGARWSKKPAQSDRNADAMRTQCERIAGAVPTQSEGNAPQAPDTTIASKMHRGGRTSAPACPDGVESQTWADWLSLRKAKKAPVTPTVLDGARAEAGKAGMTLDAFLRVWCARGSQGLQADWLKPHERNTGPPGEPDWRREQRERNEAFLGPAAARRKPPTETIDATSRLLD